MKHDTVSPRAQAFIATLRTIAVACALLLLALGTDARLASAQTNIIGSPSTDVVPTGKLYGELDFFGHLTCYANGGYQTYAPRVIYGLGKGLEVGFNATMTQAALPDQPVEVQPNIKWQLYNDEARGIAISTGALGFVTVAHRVGTDDFGMLYGSISKKIAGDYGPRISGGGYDLVARADGQGDTRGATAGFEQPINKRVTWVSDWYSGANRFSYTSTGVVVTEIAHATIGVNYLFGSQGRGNNALFTWVGYTF
jgi:hypothetical protein